MNQSIGHITLVVRDYDEAINFFTKKLHFEVIENIYVPEQKKRWILIAPPHSNGTTIILGRASTSEQKKSIGNQTGGRVLFSLQTDDFWRDYKEMISKDIKFVREPEENSKYKVAVFEDLYGNLWDLIQYI
ncbi:MAG TPA: VOC family protein [Patescibacteria group bacterium]|nr:VOC family protein [Patescibacteria group bacterium]